MTKSFDYMKMPFGKHVGVTLDKLPEDYVVWLYNWQHVRPDMKQELQRCMLEIHGAPADWDGERSSEYDPDTDYNDGWGDL